VSGERRNPVDEILPAHDDTPDSAPLPVDVFGGRVHHKIRAVPDRLLKDWCGENVVDEKDDVPLAAEPPEPFEVDEVEPRVRRRLDEADFGVGLDEPFPFFR